MQGDIDKDRTWKTPIVKRLKTMYDTFESTFEKTECVVESDEPKQAVVDDVKRTFGSSIVNITHPDENQTRFVISDTISHPELEQRLNTDVRIRRLEFGVLKM